METHQQKFLFFVLRSFQFLTCLGCDFVRHFRLLIFLIKIIFVNCGKNSFVYVGSQFQYFEYQVL